MTALALCAQDLGIKVSGSDVEEHFVTDETLKQAGIIWKTGFQAKNIGKPELVIFTAAHGGQANVEVVAAEEKKIPVLSQAQALGLFTAGKKTISVCGVGGKSTTSAMIATIFRKADLKPSYAVGVGRINPLRRPGRFNKKGHYFIAEADEYFSSPQDPTPKFLYQNPHIVVITNIEFDHPDAYQNLEQTLASFASFANRVDRDGLVVICADSLNNQKLIQSIKAPFTTYGFSPKADWRITSFEQRERKTKFEIEYQGVIIKNLTIRLPGKFNVKNAVAALVAANFCGVPFHEIKNSLRIFGGTQRRFEFVRRVSDIIIYDDYAHHPAQIKATLATAKKFFPNKRIMAVFQPHTYSRTKALFKEFSQAFSDANIVVITDIYGSAREKKDPQVSGRLLAQEVAKFHPRAFYQKGEEEVIQFLKKNAKKKDVIFTLGAGNIFNWHTQMIKRIKRPRRQKLNEN